ncbi:MAG: gamma-glutamylcyclotransferase [Gammaproteobacteria bacterium]|nr:gamma-glutamylcyclotransferase [Gammaproteobacteria bacterium]
MNTDDPHEIELVFADLPAGDFWVFAYGSLMWRPDFDFVEKRDAWLPGYRRSLCVWSWHHRGTEENPGLVFGLDKSVAKADIRCQGCVYRVAAENRVATLINLRDRELITNIYQPAVLDLQTAQQETLPALTFIVDQQHPQYAGQLPAERCAEIVRSSRGKSGENTDYVLSTWNYLAACNIQDEHLRAVCEHLA